MLAAEYCAKTAAAGEAFHLSVHRRPQTISATSFPKAKDKLVKKLEWLFWPSTSIFVLLVVHLQLTQYYEEPKLIREK